MNLTNARVLLTGASGGIGKALAGALVEVGASVLLHGRSQQKLEIVKQGLVSDCAKKVNISLVVGDLTQDNDLVEIVDVATTYDINVLVNCAGINEFCRFENADIESQINTNVIATMKLTQALLPLLKRQSGEQPNEVQIVNIGSTFGVIGFPGYVAYCASKHALKGFSEALARELADLPLDVIYVSPRATDTAMNTSQAAATNMALGVKMDSPEYVAKQIILSMGRNMLRRQLGWPEKLQVKINALLPWLVDGAISKQLMIIKSNI